MRSRSNAGFARSQGGVPGGVAASAIGEQSERDMLNLSLSGMTQRRLIPAGERIVLDHGICSRDDVISSLRKDRLREIDPCTSVCRTPGNPPNHYGSLDVAPVSNRE